MGTGKIKTGITRLTLNGATFSDVSVEPSLVNFFYGRNGVGKSTFARAVEMDEGIEWASGVAASDYDVLVYGQDFIDRNFRTMNDLPGVFMMAEENIQIQEQIDEASAKASDQEKTRDDALRRQAENAAAREALDAKFGDDCWGSFAGIKKAFDKALSGKKTRRGFVDALLAGGTAEEQDLDALQTMYDTAYDPNARTYNTFSRVGQAPRYAQLAGVGLLDQRIVSSSDTEFARFMNAIDASSWVRQGHEHYADAAGGKCPYCQRELPDDFEATLAASFDEQYGRDIEALSTLQASYESEMQSILQSLRANLDDPMPTLDLGDYSAKLELLASRVQTNAQRISQKMGDPTKEVSLEDTDSLLVDLGTVIDGLNKSIEANNVVASSKKEKKVECEDLVWRHVLFMLQGTIDQYTQEKKKLDEAAHAIDADLEAAKSELRALSAQIRKLKKQVVNTSAAAEAINDMLLNAGFQGFSLREQQGAQNVYEVVRENGSVADKLSEGERNFIAFLYFYHLTLGSATPDGGKKKLVVIDDPVSSMDSGSLFVVGALVRNMIRNCLNNADYEGDRIEGNEIKQLFVLTHNVYFHREITYDQVKNYRAASFFIIRKVDNVSTVKPCLKTLDSGGVENYNPVQGTYSALWDELGELRSPIPVMNVIRQILEYYFLQLCGYEGDRIRERVLEENKSLFIVTPEDGGKPDMTRFVLAEAMLSHISNQPGFSDGLHYVEDCDDAEQYKHTLKLIFDALGQSQHYDMMTNMRS